MPSSGNADAGGSSLAVGVEALGSGDNFIAAGAKSLGAGAFEDAAEAAASEPDGVAERTGGTFTALCEVPFAMKKISTPSIVKIAANARLIPTARRDRRTRRRVPRGCEVSGGLTRGSMRATASASVRLTDSTSLSGSKLEFPSAPSSGIGARVARMGAESKPARLPDDLTTARRFEWPCTKRLQYTRIPDHSGARCRKTGRTLASDSCQLGQCADLAQRAPAQCRGSWSCS